MLSNVVYTNDDIASFMIGLYPSIKLSHYGTRIYNYVIIDNMNFLIFSNFKDDLTDVITYNRIDIIKMIRMNRIIMLMNGN